MLNTSLPYQVTITYLPTEHFGSQGTDTHIVAAFLVKGDADAYVAWRKADGHQAEVLEGGK